MMKDPAGNEERNYVKSPFFYSQACKNLVLMIKSFDNIEKIKKNKEKTKSKLSNNLKKDKCKVHLSVLFIFK